MFAELLLCACAVAAVFTVLGANRAALFAMPLLVWCAYRLGRASASPSTTQRDKVAGKSARDLR